MATEIQVLIVDDISSTLDNLKKLLSFEDDIQVIATATNGREAVDTAKQVHPDVVLMDVNMPEMDGIQATELLATEAPGSPVIIMSVQGERDYLRRAMQSGAREFLIKPFSGDELIASIRRVHQLEQRKENYNRSATVPGATDATIAAAAAPRPEAAPAADAGAAPAPTPDAAAAPAEVPTAAPEAAPAPEAATDGPAGHVSEAAPAAVRGASGPAPEAEEAPPEPAGPSHPAPPRAS